MKIKNIVILIFYLICPSLSLFNHSAKASDFVDSLMDESTDSFLSRNKNLLVYPVKEVTKQKRFSYGSIPRKAFLMGFVSLVMSSAFHTAVCQNDNSKHSNLPLIRQSRVAIIGGGLSGLTMGHRLKQKGYQNIAVYEAKSRVGGRVHTVYVKNNGGTYSMAELGGHSITDGGDAEHFLNLTKELGLEIEDDPRCLSRGFYANGKLYDSKELLRTSGFTQEKLSEILQTLPPSACSMADVIDYVFAENPLLKRVFTYHVGSYEGLPTKNLAIFHNIETFKFFLPGGKAAFQETKGTDEPFVLRYVKGGNSRLPLALAGALEGRVFLNKALRRVSRYEGGIKLEFTDNTTSFCDKLILSIPCSTFKDIIWEDSLLSKERLDEMHQVEYGANGKIVVPLDASSRKPNYSSVTADHIGTLENNDYKLLVFFTDGVWGKSLNKNLKHYYPSITEMVEANYGKQQDLQSEPVTVSAELYSRYDKPIVKSWAEDPYAQGSYSAVGTMLGSRFLEKTEIRGIPFKAMFTPINDEIFFIGEHTSVIEEMGSMEAAVESAERQARLF